jgi:drug/metabolite transporter (DMT)-like permease
MQTLFYSAIAVIPWIAITLLLRYMVNVEGLSASLVGVLSRAVCLPLLGGWILARGAGWRRFGVRGEGRRLALMGIVSIVINLAWFYSLQWTTATNVAILIRTDIVFVILIGAICGLERIRPAQLAVVPLMLLGLGMLCEIQHFDFAGHLTGDLLVICAALAFSINAFIIRVILKTLDGEVVAEYNHGISALGFLAVVLLQGQFSDLPELYTAPRASAVVGLGICTAIGLPLYYLALKHMPVWKLRVCMLAGPVFTALIERWCWGLVMTWIQMLGAGMILAGLAAIVLMDHFQRQADGAVSVDAAEPPTPLASRGHSPEERAGKTA